MKLGVMKIQTIELSLIIGLAAFSLSSCFKEKPLKTPSNVGIGKTNVINMDPNYSYQFFYSLETNQIISSNSRSAYDLMFDCDANKFHIWLNTAKFMCALNTNQTDFNAVTVHDTLNSFFWNYERGSYNVDSSALGNWWTTLPTSAQNVYVINLGRDTLGKELGFVKMQVLGFNGNSYSIRYASLTSSDSGTITVPKDPTRNYRYVGLSDQGKVVDGIEPDKSTWDLCFTHYTFVFHEPGYLLPYPVEGVLHNPYKVEAYVDSLVNYDSASMAKFNPSLLQHNRDAVGYEWKRWTGFNYTTKSYYVFYIQTGPNTYYKLHFISFNNPQGVKGYPSFEYQQL